MNVGQRLDNINIGLMLLALLFSRLAPFENFLIAFAVLGPLHYVTEISWLKDRNFFMPRAHDKWALLLLFVTLIHVYVFTGAFVLSGAMKNGIKSGYIAVAVF